LGKRVHVVVASVLLIGIGIGLSINVSAAEELIPSWIKTTAGFWVDGAISDSEFISALQFLVKEGILFIPTADDDSKIIIEKGSGEKIPWSENTLLRWNDFQGESDYESDRGASTGWYLENDWTWQITNSQPCEYQITEILADAYFLKNESWVKPDEKTNPLLKHEQGHFDITEIFARELEKRSGTELLGKQFSCPPDEGSFEDGLNEQIDSMIAPIFDLVFEELEQMHMEYDADTNHSIEVYRQLEWDKKIDDLLG